MKNILQSRVGAVVAGAGVLAVVGAGTAVAAGQITGGDIKNGTIASADVKNKSLKTRDISAETVAKLKGRRGPAGPAGEPGAAGQSIVATEITPANSNYGGVQVVDVDSIDATAGGPTADGGAQLVDPVELEEGTYLVTSTAQFFDLQPTESGDDVDYGVAKLFLDGENIATSWSPQVPDDGNNAAQAGGTVVVTVPEGGGTLSTRAALRGGDGGQAGANLIVTRVEGADEATPTG